MTPLQIAMMIHYYVSPEPYAKYEPDHAQSGAVTKQRIELVDLGLLDVGHKVTPKGNAYIEALCNMPLPICKWVLP